MSQILGGGGLTIPPGSNPQARAFAAASLQYLSQASPIVPVYPFSVSLWFYDNNGASGQKALWSSAASANDTHFLLIDGDGANHVEMQYNAAGGGTTIETSATYANGVWSHVCAVWAAANDIRIYLNGANKVTSVAGNATPTTTRMAVGAYYGATLGQYWDGGIGEVGIHSVALDDASALALSTGIPAFLIRPDALHAYWPLFGNGSPELDQSGGGKHLTLVNAPTKSATRPPVFYPANMTWAAGS